MEAGDGGYGATKGGAGGSVTKGYIANSSLNEHGVQVTAGNGGGTSGSKSVLGAGGSISNLELYVNSDVEFTAGSAAHGSAIGAAGGSISSITFNAYGWADNEVNLRFTAGNGGGGGVGGSIDNITDANVTPYGLPADSLNLAPAQYNLFLTAGNSQFAGGASGAGGSVKNVTLIAPNEGWEFSLLAGNGAAGTIKPGFGGVLENIKILDQVSSFKNPYTGKVFKKTASFDRDYYPVLGSVTLESGDGGSGYGVKGANGGYIKNVAWNLDGLTRILTPGYGGAGTSPGDRGAVINVNAPATS